MRDVDDEDVDADANQFRRAFEVITGRADGGADPQSSLIIARRERQALLAEQVLRRHQPDQPTIAIDERQLLDLPLDHDPLHLVGREHAELRRQRPAATRAAGTTATTASIGTTGTT